jgi:DNA-binding PadR family transcriptional regulator
MHHMGGRGGSRRSRKIDDLERLVAMGQAGRGRGGPPFGGPFGGGRGRRRRGDVRLALLLLLNEEPRNGYGLMQEIEERSGGRWRPSPGSVYPTLQQLEDEGLIRALDADGTKLFELTDSGREHVAAHGEKAAPWDDDDDESNAASDLKSQIKQFHVALMQFSQFADEEQVARATEIVSRARKDLYRMLAEDTDE